MNIVALVIATLIPLIFLYVIYTQDLYGTGSFKTVALCFAWGGIAVGIALYVNPFLKDQLALTNNELTRWVAPVSEEILKGLVLLYLVRRPNFTYFVDGAIYGFAAGMGFAIFENYLYLSGPGAGTGTAVGRVISTNLMHATASGLVGIGFGLSRFEKGFRKWGTISFGLVMAMVLHSVFNNLASGNLIPGVTQTSSSLLLYAGGIGLLGLGSIYMIIRRGLAEQREWIAEKLGAADRVTSGEAAMVNQLADAHDLLAPLAEIFGAEKAEQIENFLTLQAQLGIKRKTLDKLTEEKMKTAVRAEMDDIRAKMEVARREVGAYCMLSLRTIFPEDNVAVWGKLESAIEDKIASRPATGGMNLWDKVGKSESRRKTEATTASSPGAETTSETSVTATVASETTAEEVAPEKPAAANPWAKLESCSRDDKDKSDPFSKIKKKN